MLNKTWDLEREHDRQRKEEKDREVERQFSEMFAVNEVTRKAKEDELALQKLQDQEYQRRQIAQQI